MTDKEKLLKYIEYKGISKTAFYKETGFSCGFLDKGTSICVDNLRVILDKYHDLSSEWMVLEIGDMIVSKDSQKDKSSEIAELKKQLKHEKELRSHLEEINTLLREKLSILEK